ncbi:hypothetical protein [Streptomyces chrestomyceticus]|uniref:hypothetical protein n=1 Tax=Streptomyces chrestomyceticus TaxID=68185 RepID=UPI0033CC3B6B
MSERLRRTAFGRLAPLARGGGQARLLARHQALTEAHRYDSDMSARRAPMVACLALAAELAAAWGIVPFGPPDARVWAEVFAVGDQSDNRGEMALDIVREYVATHRRELWCPYGDGDHPFSGWIGRTLQHEGRDTVGLLAERLKETLRRSGYELDSVLPSWRESGVLVENSAYRPPYLLSKKINASKARMYVFQPEVFTTTEDDGE